MLDNYEDEEYAETIQDNFDVNEYLDANSSSAIQYLLETFKE